MTDPNKAHITLLVDRTGSMAPIRADAEGAVNAFVEDQQKLPTRCTLLLAEFDAPSGLEIHGETSWFNVVHDGDLADAPTYRLQPRGSTALFDALGMAITTTGERLAALPEDERPSLVYIVVQTDGQENSSHDWRLPVLIEAIKRQEQDYGWTFIFLGTGLDAVQQSQVFAGTQMVDNVVRATGSGASTRGAYATTSSNIASARGGAKDVTYGDVVDDAGNTTP